MGQRKRTFYTESWGQIICKSLCHCERRKHGSIGLYIRSDICHRNLFPERGRKFKDFLVHSINLLKPTGYVMHHQFNIQQLYTLPTVYLFIFCIYLRTNNYLCHLHHKLIGSYNRVVKCLQRGTDWVFK
jgi:hypothetical protein